MQPIRGLCCSRVVGGNWLNCRLTAKETLSNEVPNRSSVSGAPAIYLLTYSLTAAPCAGELWEHSPHLRQRHIFNVALDFVCTPKRIGGWGSFKSWIHAGRFSLGHPSKNECPPTPVWLKSALPSPPIFEAVSNQLLFGAEPSW